MTLEEDSCFWSSLSMLIMNDDANPEQGPNTCLSTLREFQVEPHEDRPIPGSVYESASSIHCCARYVRGGHLWTELEPPWRGMSISMSMICWRALTVGRSRRQFTIAYYTLGR